MKTLQKPVPPGGMIGPVPPGGTIGIIGGGQLGRMLAMAAARLGLKTCIFNDTPDAPAFQVTPHHVVAPYEDIAALEAFADRCDAVTFEFENLPAHAIARLAEHVWVAPGAQALAITQDRLSEKSFVAKLGLATAPFREVSSPEQARAAIAELGGTASGFQAGRYCGNTGGYIPFAATRAERLAKGDPRPSLEERYPSHDAYVAKVKAAADALVAQRYLLAADAARIVTEAQAAKIPL